MTLYSQCAIGNQFKFILYLTISIIICIFENGYIFMTNIQQCRMEEEGYTVSQQSNFTPPETVVQKAIETLSLKELSEKNGTEYNKVSNYTL